MSEITIVLSDNLDTQYEELRHLADRYDNASDLDGIHEVCRRVLKHDGDCEQAIREIKEISYRNYERR